MKSYRSLFSRSKAQEVTSAFAKFHPVGRNDAEPWKPHDEPWRAIARKTLDTYESWGFNQDRFKAKYPRTEVQKLRNYLDYTFVRLLDLEASTPGTHFVNSSDLEWVAFNTGLQNSHAVDLLAVFQRHHPSIATAEKPHNDWTYRGCYAANESGYRDHFGSAVPEIAYYSLDSRDFVFNVVYQLEKDGFDHLLERGKQRAGLPSSASDDAIRTYLRGALELVIPKIKRNYKVAIPVYYVEEKKMQLLLPFSSMSNEVSCFLVDRDDDEKTYKLKTIYDLDHAYFAARLITRPDEEWLNP